MDTDPAYGDLLEKARLDERGRALGLNDPSIFETYVMNFEIHRILGRALGRGGASTAEWPSRSVWSP